jgi:hypothetical protein
MAAAALALPSAASAQPYFGFNDSSFWTETTPAQSAALHADAGATSTRIVVDWAAVEATPGSFVWSAYDAIYSAQLARGIRPLFQLFDAPPWAWEPSRTCPADEVCHFPPARAHDAEWSRFARSVAARYPQIVGIEVWNEPNISDFWRGGVDPVRYTELLKLASKAIKATRRTMPVISAGLAGVLAEPDTAQHMTTRRFLQAMYANGMRGTVDGVGLHPYPEDIDFGRSYRLISLAEDTRDANGDSVPLWLTEFGLSTTDGRFTEKNQALVITNLWDRLRRYPGVAAAYVHSLVESSDAAPDDQGRGWGVLHVDLSPKPAYCAIAKLNAGAYTCPAGVATVPVPATQGLLWEAQDALQAAAEAALTHRRATGSFLGFTAQRLAALDPRFDPKGINGDVSPGAQANANLVGVWASSDGSDSVALCNASRADRSYCILARHGGDWTYGSYAGTVYRTLSAVRAGTAEGW